MYSTRHRRHPRKPHAVNASLLRLADLIEAHYVFPEPAATISAQLRTRFADVAPEDVAANVKPFLRGHDRHLSVIDKLRPASTGPARIDFTDRDALRRINYGFRNVHVADRIATIDLTMLCDADDPVVRGTAAAALALTAHAHAVILDLRGVPGGWPSGADALLGHFLPDQPTHLLTMTRRDADDIEQHTPDNNPYGHRPDVALFILVDNTTASAGESLAYNAQSLGRAQVIGEPTAGAANPGDFFDVDDRFRAFIPTMAPIDPRTGTNWEGIGVQPDDLVASNDALTRATELARSAARRAKPG
jgi:C-terminal processing protease CtpA/Prc